MARTEKTVFISYRRTNVPWALAVWQSLTHSGYDVFFDYQGIASGDFEQVILGNIRARAHFLVLLTPSALEKVGEPDDWLRREIETALDTHRNIVPLMLEGFDFDTPSIARHLTGTLGALRRYNALRVPPDYFEEAMRRVCERYLAIPLDAVLHPASTQAVRAGKHQQRIASAAPAVSAPQLSGEQWFELGFQATDVREKIRCYDEVIHRRPYEAAAYHNRSLARAAVDDLGGALEDCDAAIRLKPGYADAYINRGNVRKAKGDLHAALDDYGEAIRLKPDEPISYVNRGLIREALGDLQGAVSDYDEAIRLKPDDKVAIQRRRLVRKSTRRPDQAAASGQASVAISMSAGPSSSGPGVSRPADGTSRPDASSTRSTAAALAPPLPVASGSHRLPERHSDSVVPTRAALRLLTRRIVGLFGRRAMVPLLLLGLAIVGWSVGVSVPGPSCEQQATHPPIPKIQLLDLAFESNPSGAEVYVVGSNQYLGRTPLRAKVEHRSDRTTSVVFRLTGYLQTTKEVGPDWSGVVNLQAAPNDEAPSEKSTSDTSPDEVAKAVAMAKTAAMKAEAAAAPRVARKRAAEGGAKTVEEKPRAGDKNRVVTSWVDPFPAETEEKPGGGDTDKVHRLAFRSLPFGAEVIIDGEYFARTPCDRRIVDSNQQFAITVRKEGYLPFERTVGPSDRWVKKGNEMVLTVSVALKKAASPENSPTAPAAGKKAKSLDELLGDVGTKKAESVDDLLGDFGKVATPEDEPAKPFVKLPTLTQSDIVTAMKGVQRKVQACANQYKQVGTAMVVITVARGGKVTEATASGTFADTPTGACVAAAAKSAKFPPCQAMTYPWPFTLIPRGK